MHEIQESVIGIAAMRDEACIALATADYCENDLICYCTPEPKPWWFC
jgi:hypothetical protein